MRKLMLVFPLVVLLLSGPLFLLRAAEPNTAWALTGTSADYQLSAQGDPRSDEGANVSLRSDNEVPEKFGAAVTTLDATPYRKQTIVLSGDIATINADTGAALWLRADGGKSRAFVNSQDRPVKGTSLAKHIEIQIDVPDDALKIVLGALVKGSGQATITNLRLSIANVSKDATNVSPAQMIDAAIGIVKAHALRARNVDWGATEVAVRAMVIDSKTSADTYPAIRMLLSRLEDHHSTFLEPTWARTIATQGYASKDPVIKGLPSGIGYISMPAYMGTEETAIRKFAKSVRSSIHEVAKSARCGWIVDLRNDTGGNMWPMVQSLQPLLGVGPLGRFDETTGQSPAWNASASDDTAAERPKDNLTASNVAVLIGPKTASSGEAVAIAFIGRANTRSFGEATAGLTTSNKPFDLPDGSRIFLTTGVDVDRNGRAYSGAIVPDEPIADSVSSGSDPDMAAAKTWLASTKACRKSAVKN